MRFWEFFEAKNSEQWATQKAAENERDKVPKRPRKLGLHRYNHRNFCITFPNGDEMMYPFWGFCQFLYFKDSPRFDLQRQAYKGHKGSEKCDLHISYPYINPTGEKDNQNVWVGHRRSLSWRTWKTRLKLHRSRLTARCGQVDVGLHREAIAVRTLKKHLKSSNIPKKSQF